MTNGIKPTIYILQWIDIAEEIKVIPVPKDVLAELVS